MGGHGVEQARYQVRFDWGVPGARAVGADADVVVWVDALGGPDAAGEGPGPPLGDLPATAAVVELTDGAGDAAAVAARWVLHLQEALRRRLVVAVVAAGARRAEGDLRMAVEDLLAAGAVIGALADVGIDATSPEAAAADAARRGLRHATGHILTACVSAAAGARPTPGPGLVVVRPHPDRPHPERPGH